jgi:hypothetical protein
MKFVLLAAVLWAVSCYCQEGTLAFDTSNMEITIRMDRQIYLPGEEAQVTLRIANRSSTPVVSLKPFITSTSCLYYTEKDDPWRRAGPAMSESCAGADIDSSNTTRYAPGETKEIVMNSYDKLFDSGRTVLLDRAVPTGRGAYTLFFRYGSKTVQMEYTVAAAKLEGDAMARVHDTMFSDSPRKIPLAAIPMFIHVIALRSGDESYICVQQASVSRASTLTRKEFLGLDLDVEDPRVHLGVAVPFKRVATRSAPISTLSATADADENLTIEWTDSDGRKDHLFYPAFYPARK